MKKILILLTTLLLVLNFTACSKDDVTGENSKNIEVIEAMMINENYTLSIGDKISKLTDDARIQISQNSKEDQTVYTLLVGEAEIHRK